MEENGRFIPVTPRDDRSLPRNHRGFPSVLVETFSGPDRVLVFAGN